MDQGNQLFTLALGLVPPWAVDDVRFTMEEKRLDLHVNFPKGSRFPCPVCGQECPVHRHPGEGLAPSGLLPACGLPPRPSTAGTMPGAWGAFGAGPLGTGRLGIHAALRGTGYGDGARDAGADGCPHDW